MSQHRNRKKVQVFSSGGRVVLSGVTLAGSLAFGSLLHHLDVMPKSRPQDASFVSGEELCSELSEVEISHEGLFQLSAAEHRLVKGGRSTGHLLGAVLVANGLITSLPQTFRVRAVTQYHFQRVGE
jgi:hypothetical protein